MFILSAFTLQTQSGDRERYSDIDLFFHWQENEFRDNTYRKAYLQYVADSAGQNRLDILTSLIKEKRLGEEYRAIISVPEETTPDGNELSEQVSDNSPTKSDKVESLLSLADRAARKNDPALETEALNAAFAETFLQEKDYDLAFYIGFRLEEKLSRISEAEYPYKREAYYRLGEAYYLMLDFHKSIRLLENALSDMPAAFDDQTNLDALNILGICHANIGQMDISDQYFRATLLSKDIVLDRPLYNTYALAHLGCNAMLTGQYDKALAISNATWPLLRKETDDYGHLAGMCYCRGRSYLEKKDFRQASVWIDSLVYFANRDHYNQTKRIKQAHLLRADYYTAIGNARQAKVYNDSLINIYKRGEGNHTSGYIARASQRYNSEKIADREAKLHTNGIRLVFISIVAICCFALVCFILSLYHKRNAAYKTLAQKADVWARETPTVTQEIPIDTTNEKAHKGKATEEDREIMLLAEHEMNQLHAYRESGLTMELLAERISVHRNALSRAINRTSGQNFSQYINGYRIKEAVRIIAESGRDRLYIEELYERVGFSNRSTFYRTFKQFTGISPIDFQKNKDTKDSFKYS